MANFNLTEINLTGIKTSAIASLKAFAANNQIAVEGDKRLRATWEAAIELWLVAKQEAVAMAKETVEGAIECVNEAKELVGEAIEQHVTYDNAVLVANKTNVLVRGAMAWLWSVGVPWLGRAIATTLLVAISLIAIAVEFCVALWSDVWNDAEDRQTVKVQVYRAAKEFVRSHRVSGRKHLAKLVAKANRNPQAVKTEDLCDRCGENKKEWVDMYCQECWEGYTSDGYWKMIEDCAKR